MDSVAVGVPVAVDSCGRKFNEVVAVDIVIPTSVLSALHRFNLNKVKTGRLV
jgi:hypothetical protein